MHLPPINILQIFVRNRTLGGWSRQKIAAALRQRLAWDKLDLAAMDDATKERYEATKKILEELETQDN